MYVMVAEYTPSNIMDSYQKTPHVNRVLLHVCNLSDIPYINNLWPVHLFRGANLPIILPLIIFIFLLRTQYIHNIVVTQRYSVAFY